MHTLTSLSFRFIFLSILAVGTAKGAAAVEVSGTVTDEQGQPLAGASVVLREAASGLQRYGTATDADGAFAFPDVEAGRYDLLVSFVGYATHAQALQMLEEPIRLEIRLAVYTAEQPGVVVTATRGRPRLTPITFSTLAAADLERLPNMKDLPVLLSTLPSITYHSENGNGIGYSTLRMRGFDQRRVAVTINGIPQNDPEDFNVYWINFFDVQETVEDIQVQRGAGSSFYGPAAIGGAINIVATPYRPQPFVRLEAGYGAYDTQRYTVEANTGLLGGQYVAYGRYSRLLSDGYRDWSWTKFHRFFAGAVRYDERSTLTVQAYGGPQYDGLAFVGIPKAANESDTLRRANFSSLTGDVERFHQPHVELLHDWRLSPDWTFHQALFGTKGEGYFEFGGTFRSADYLRLPAGWRGLTAEQRALPLFISAPDVAVLFRAYLDQWHMGWLPRLTYRHATGETSMGAEVSLHRSVRWGRIQEGSGVPAELVGSENDVRVYQYHGEKVVASLTGSHLFRPVERVAVQGDLQVTYRQYRHYEERFFGQSFRVPFVFVNPRLGLTLNPERPLSAYASISYTGREPRLKSFYDGEEAGAGFLPQFERNEDGSFDYDRPIVKPEYLLDVELGGALSSQRYRLAANLFLMDFRDEIVPSGGLDQFGVPRSGNADRTRHMGIEVEAAAQLLPGLEVQGNLTLSRNRFIRFTEFVTQPDFSVAPVERDGNPIAGFPDQVANLGLLYRWAGLSLSLDGKYAGRQYIDNSGGRGPGGEEDEDLILEPYTLVNASARYAFPQGSALGGLELSLDVNNVLDKKVLLYGNVGAAGPQFFPTATRHVFAAVRYTVR
jgi:iron complex outermembrane recepter protein